MPLEATHIKFALDLKSKYKIQNLSEYLSGTIYPDSRYISKIERKLTHTGQENISNNMGSDFKNGWAIHLLCDKVCNKAIEETLPELFVDVGPAGQGTERWIIKTAIKGIQDMEIYKQFNPNPYLDMVDYFGSPNNEPTEIIKEYNRIIKEMYFGKKEITLKDIGEMWLKFSGEPEVIGKINRKTEQLLKNPDIETRIKNLYSLMINECLV
ncbi:MAG: hypothetical protein V1848_02205 [Candidatus Magasanikbacteria bacterium]